VCRVTTRSYPPQVGSVADARHWAESTFDRWALRGNPVTDAVLLTSELVTNAVLHARTPLVLSLAVAEDVIEVGVSDSDPRGPRPRRQEGAPWATRTWLLGEPPAETGRGLLLVDELADEWGVAQMTGGKQIWFRLDAGPDWPHRAECPCDGEELGSVRLESGRRVIEVAGPWDDPHG
jgi:anti-sigma regulatory factor (Ser/Thr protein kinase)